MKRYWLTARGVLVFESGQRRFETLPNGKRETKIQAFRSETGGFHGWLWLKNLKSAKAPKKVAP